MTDHHILLAGNPNVGKSTIFNALTGLKQHTGNWSGKTVALAEGILTVKDCRFLLSDLPGTYSLISNSPEEEIARDAICFGDADCTLMIADATCLARNLNLLLQILEITPRAALCVNLTDEAKRRGIRIDLDTLSKQLGIPVIGISAKNRRDMRRLQAFLIRLATDGFPARDLPPPVLYPPAVEDAIHDLSASLQPFLSSSHLTRHLSLKLLDNPVMTLDILNNLGPSEDVRTRLLEQVATVKQSLQSQGLSAIHLRDAVVGAIAEHATRLAAACTHYDSNAFQERVATYADRILTSKKFGIPIMIGFLGLLLWITIWGANVPSQLLLSFLESLRQPLGHFLALLQLPPLWVSLLTDGVYHTTAWVTAVMLPPMAIFFPLFTLLEDLGVLPRLAFNLDRCFCKASSCGKQALTMCMGLGCNAVGVTGCRIFSSRKERFAAMITNCFIPCNGRFSMLITLSLLFVSQSFPAMLQTPVAALFILLLLLLGVLVSLAVTRILTLFFFKEERPGFFLELPPFRRPKIVETLVRSFWDRTLTILFRAIRVSAPAGAIIWLLANTSLQGVSLLQLAADFLHPLAALMGLDGMILLAFLLALPANEIVLPILLMGYLANGQMSDMENLSSLKTLFVDNGWTLSTAINVMLFSLLHFPCATTLWTIRKESGSTLWMLLGFAIPTLTAILVCMATNGFFTLIEILLV